jgi:hypothetical protein
MRCDYGVGSYVGALRGTSQGVLFEKIFIDEVQYLPAYRGALL